MNHILRLLLLALAAMPALHAELTIFHQASGQPEATKTAGQIIVRKGDLLRIEPAPTTGSEPRSLEFEFFTTTPPTALTLRPLRNAGARLREVKLDPPGHSEAWTIHRRKVDGLPANWESLELDFSLPEGGQILIRSVGWKPLEKAAPPAAAQARRSSVAENVLEAELSRSYPASISSVDVGTEQITIQGNASTTPGPLFLAEIPMDRLIDDDDRFETLAELTPAKDGSFQISLPRLRERSGFYQRSMRLTDLIVRQYDPNARAFISLTHHWADPGPPPFYGSRKMLELLARFTAAEGDFPWSLAHHPYPSSLRKPRTREDADATFRFDSPKITPRNIEVLDAWMKRPEMRYCGETRPVHLSENGFNSPDYSPKSLTDQAAGMAYAWNKILPLETIQVWHYHNWIDNRPEGGLRIGLRRCPDDETDPHGPKPIWHLYQALATPREKDASSPYLPVIGIQSWQEILHTGPIR